MYRRLFIAILAMVSVISLVPPTIWAQDGGVTVIEYGETVTGEITDQQFEIEYQFEGLEGQVIIVLMVAADGATDMSAPSVIVTDSDYSVLSSNNGYRSVTIVFEIPADGTYSIIATRNNGRAGDSVGEFNLTLLNPTELFQGEPVAGTATREEESYYLIRSETDFTLHYSYDRGEFIPRIVVSVIDAEDGEMDTIAAIEGRHVSSGSLTVNTSTLDTSTYIIFTSRPSTYEYYPEDASVEFTLTYE